jgi:Ca2+:H+ antiporter
VENAGGNRTEGKAHSPRIERRITARQGPKNFTEAITKTFFQNPVNWLLGFIPVAAVLDHAHRAPAALVFGTTALAFVPLAAKLVEATEHIASRTNAALGGLLNATFGNAPELIIALVALRAGQLDLVKASIVGAILGNLLFVLGVAFIVGGRRHHIQKFNAQGALVQCSMLLIAAVSMIVPSLFHGLITPQTAQIEQRLNDAVTIVLLFGYGLSLLFMLRTHPDYFKSAGETQHDTSGRPAWSIGGAIAVLIGASVLLAFLSEILVGSVEETAKGFGLSKAFIGVIFMALIGGAAESFAAITMARKNQLDLTIGIAVGSSQQIALFVAPVLVLSSHILAPQPMNLVLGPAGAIIIFLAVLIVTLIASDGQANWFKGVQLLCVYLLIALFCYFLPDNLGRNAAAS